LGSALILKLEEAARKAIELLREAGEIGIYNIELAQKLKVPKRRVYDIVNPLKPLGLIEIKKERGKTKICWLEKKEAAIKPEKGETPEKEKSRLKIETVKLVEENPLLESVIGDQGEEGFKFNCAALRISCGIPSKACRVYHDGFEVVVETDGGNLVVKPNTLKPKTPKIKTVF
jgi:hypothetical protein